MIYLSVDRLSVGYGSRPVLQEFSLGVPRGAFLAVVGPNGCGKSTLVKAISRALKPSAGKVALADRDIWALKPRDLARQVAVVAQETGVEFDFTVEEVVAMGRLPHVARFRRETAADERAVQAALTATSTTHLAGRLVTGLSGGERQRVMVARALAQEPQLLILDEPTAHLDIAHQVELLDLTRRLNREQGLTVIAVLHDLNLAAQYADRLLMMKEGRRFAEGAPADVVTEPNVAAVYGSRVKVTVHPEEGSPHVILLSGERSRDEWAC
ncbi:MAG TPA: heme ABC transporter ATP-binding protein [Symbiobacteriaceae bacterium]|nr:heme ABC transporter ATP-binding protein [Symbiobacteriaceae bacterium]